MAEGFDRVTLCPPLLFILAIDPLSRLLQKATDMGLLTKLNGRAARFRTAMYADDAVIFLKPTRKDVSNLKLLLEKFGLVTGLQTNLKKRLSRQLVAPTLISTSCSPDYRWPVRNSRSNILGYHFQQEGCAGWTSNRRSTKLLQNYPNGAAGTSHRQDESASPKRSCRHNRYIC
jgi:hypothetical protein